MIETLTRNWLQTFSAVIIAAGIAWLIKPTIFQEAWDFINLGLH